MVFQGSGVSQDQYQQVFDEVAPDRQRQPGMLYHAAGIGEDGVFVFEVWESQKALQQFFNVKLGQALERANITAPPSFIQIINTVS